VSGLGLFLYIGGGYKIMNETVRKYP